MEYLYKSLTQNKGDRQAECVTLYHLQKSGTEDLTPLPLLVPFPNCLDRLSGGTAILLNLEPPQGEDPLAIHPWGFPNGARKC